METSTWSSAFESTTKDVDRDDNPTNQLILAIIVVFGAGFVIMIVCGIGICCCRKRRKKQPPGVTPPPLRGIDNDYLITAVPLDRPKQPSGYTNMGADKPYNKSDFTVPEVLQKALIATVETYILDPRRLTIGHILGQGRYGRVYAGTLRDRDQANPKKVAVKAVIEEECTERDAKELIQEAIRMRGFQHPHVIGTLGLVFDSNRPLVIMPFMKNGDLKSFLSDSKRQFTVRDLLMFGVQAAEGMVYLSQQNFIHRDLAARNCMVDDNEKVQIGDFGLAHDVLDEDYYRLDETSRPLPVRWLAIECITELIYSKESDVWSYGVLLWELFTRATVPYVGMTNEQVIRYVKRGKVLKKPTFAASPVYNMMQRCWHKEPPARPSFVQLASELRDILSEERVRNAKNPNVPELADNDDYYNTKTKTDKHLYDDIV